MLLRNHAELKDKERTVAQWLETIGDDSGYEVRQQTTNYGRTSLTAIGLIGGPTVMVEVR